MQRFIDYQSFGLLGRYGCVEGRCRIWMTCARRSVENRLGECIGRAGAAQDCCAAVPLPERGPLRLVGELPGKADACVPLAAVLYRAREPESDGGILGGLGESGPLVREYGVYDRATPVPRLEDGPADGALFYHAGGRHGFR